jgi:hypothetical protein
MHESFDASNFTGERRGSLLRLNVTIPRHAGGDDGLFLPSTIEALWIRRCAYCFTLTLSQRCLLVRRINWLAISSSVLRSI